MLIKLIIFNLIIDFIKNICKIINVERLNGDKMKKEVMTKCPICGGKLVVKALECPSCNIEINGDFAFGKLTSLSNEQANFALIFIKNAGNIKAIEKELNISYPTVKKNLEDLISALGFQKVELEKNSYNTKKDVLDALKNEEISYDEAVKLIKEIEG